MYWKFWIQSFLCERSELHLKKVESFTIFGAKIQMQYSLLMWFLARKFKCDIFVDEGFSAKIEIPHFSLMIIFGAKIQMPYFYNEDFWRQNLNLIFFFDECFGAKIGSNLYFQIIWIFAPKIPRAQNREKSALKTRFSSKRHLPKIAFISLFDSFLKQCCVLEVACSMKHHCIIMPL